MQVSSSRPSPYQVAFLVGEFALILVGTILALYLRIGQAEELFTWRYSWHRIFLVPLVLEITYYYSDLHNFRIARPFIWTVARVGQATALGTVALAVIYYLVPRLYLGRGVLILVFLTISGLVIFWRALYQWALQQRLFSTRLVVVGSGSLADNIFEELVSRSDNVYDVACIVDSGGQHGRRSGDPEPPEERVNINQAWARLLRCEISEDTGEILGLARFNNASMVVVAMDEKRGQMPLEPLLRCRMQGLPVISGEAFYEAISGRILAERIRPSWLIFSSGFSTGAMARAGKRSFDLFFSLLGLTLALPFTILTALMVRMSSKGPIIYRQERVGQYGKVFTIHKFRSMRVDAEDQSGPVWAAEDDERVTKVGRFIRKSRLDEIPQMWDVLMGHMSFVGPRPERPHFVGQLEEHLDFYNERHNVKPGITGWAQVCYPYGASESAALEKLNYDLYYIKHVSLSMDIMIVLQTIKLLLFGGGRTLSLGSPLSVAAAQDKAAALAGLLALALGAWLYAPTAWEMGHTWWHDPNYSHGFLIPPVAAWLIGRQWPELKEQAHGPSAWGLLPLVLGLLMFLTGEVVHNLFVRGISLAPVLWGLAWLAWGWPLARRLAFPLGYLWLMAPWPYVLYNGLAVPLRQMAAQISGVFLRLLGFPVLVQGNVIHLPNNVLGVVDACSGVRSLVSILAVGVLLAFLGLKTWWARAVLLIMVLPVVVFTNSCRVTAAGVMAEVIGPETLEGATHDMVGWVVFMVAFAIMAGILALLRKLSPETRDGQNV